MDELKLLVDRYGMDVVLNNLCRICHMKADRARDPRKVRIWKKLRATLADLAVASMPLLRA
jgi:hypothetical protein